MILLQGIYSIYLTNNNIQKGCLALFFFFEGFSALF